MQPAPPFVILAAHYPAMAGFVGDVLAACIHGKRPAADPRKVGGWRSFHLRSVRSRSARSSRQHPGGESAECPGPFGNVGQLVSARGECGEDEHSRSDDEQNTREAEWRG